MELMGLAGLALLAAALLAALVFDLAWTPRAQRDLTLYRDELFWRPLDDALTADDRAWLRRNGWVGHYYWTEAEDDRACWRWARRVARKRIAVERADSLRWMRLDGELLIPL